MSALMQSKQQLRTDMQKKRRACADRDARDQRILNCFLSSELYRDSAVLLCYASFGSEADTYRLIQHALSDGKSVYLPRCMPGGSEMHFYRILSQKDLQPDAFGIPAPSADPERLYQNCVSAVCVVPGLAFSVQGDRIGYGKGYYDAFLEKTEVCTVGLCYDFQLFLSIPAEPHDKHMQYICTDHGLFRCIPAFKSKG